MAYNTSPTVDKQTCTDYVDFGKCQDRFGRFSWTKIDSNYLDIKLKVFTRESKDAEFRLKVFTRESKDAEFRLRQNFTMEEADFN